MALKLSIGFQKKVGLPDYGSAGANCQVEFEIDATLLKSDLDSFHEKARHAFIACQQAVNDQLARQNSQSTNGNSSHHAPPSNGSAGSKPTNGTGNTKGNGHRNGNGSSRQATQSQARAIRAIASKQRLDLQNLLNRRFGVARPEGLSLSDASAIIDELKSGGQGGNA